MSLVSLLCHSLIPSLVLLEHTNPSLSQTSPVPNEVDKALLTKSSWGDLSEIMDQKSVSMRASSCFLGVQKMMAVTRCTRPEPAGHWPACTLTSPG